MGKDERHGAGLRGAGGLLLPLLGFLLPGVVPAQVPRAPWKGFQVILWAFGDPAPPGLAGTLRKLGVTALNCEFCRPSPWVKAAGLPVYVGHAAGKGFLYMRERNWKAVFDPWYRSRKPSLLVRRPCLSDPAAFGRALERLRETLSRLPRGRVLAFSLDDEISATRFIDPIDFCRGPFCLAAFRAYLREKYGSLDALASRWGVRLSSWKDVLPPTTDGTRRRAGKELYPEDLSRWNDHLDFRDHLLADRVSRLLAAGRKWAPGLPCGFLGGQAPAAWGGYDWSRLAPLADFLEVYDTGGAREVTASLTPPGAKRVETLFLGGNPDLLRARFYGMLAAGLSGTILWSSRKLLDRRGRPRAAARALAGAFREAAGPVGRALAGSVPDPETQGVVLLESQPSIRLHWWKDALGDGPSWPRRFGSFEAAHSTSMATRVSWIRLLEDLGFQPRFLAERNLERELFRPGGNRPRLLVLPRAVALAGKTCALVRAFVKKGGVVAADGETALYDDSLHRRKKGGLDDLFGIRRPSDPGAWNPSDRNGRPLGGAFSPEGLPILQKGIFPAKGTACRVSAGQNWAFSASPGRGKAFYWNLSLCSYATLREKGGRTPGVLLARALLGRAARAAGLRPPFQAEILSRKDAWVPLERGVRIAPGGGRLWVVRVNLGPEGLGRFAPGSRLPLRISTGPTLGLRDLRGGKDLGRGKEWTLSLDPFSFLLFEVRS